MGTTEKYMSVQIAVMKSYDMRDKVAKALIDSFNVGQKLFLIVEQFIVT
ncbi:MAG: hypothetical protein R3A12_04095 [Ignavibacteria bacterium]